MPHSRLLLIVSWGLRLIAALILLQTLFFKFTAARESVYIFSMLHAEPWGRIGSGVVELVASVLLLIPGTVVWGALLALATMAGAIFSHLTVLGISLPAVDDHGELFALALVTFACSAGLVWLYRQELPLIGQLATR
jgi:hypothetical protein